MPHRATDTCSALITNYNIEVAQGKTGEMEVIGQLGNNGRRAIQARHACISVSVRYVNLQTHTCTPRGTRTHTVAYSLIAIKQLIVITLRNLHAHMQTLTYTHIHKHTHTHSCTHTAEQADVLYIIVNYLRQM